MFTSGATIRSTIRSWIDQYAKDGTGRFRIIRIWLHMRRAGAVPVQLPVITYVAWLRGVEMGDWENKRPDLSSFDTPMER